MTHLPLSQCTLIKFVSLAVVCRKFHFNTEVIVVDKTVSTWIYKEVQIYVYYVAE